jgi:hypothetical protein
VISPARQQSECKVQMYPSHEAFRLLNKWKDEGTVVRLLLTLSFGAGSFCAKVAAIEGTNVRVVSDNSSSEFLFSLVAASFEYRTQTSQQESASNYTRSLVATFPSKAKIVFSELQARLSHEPLMPRTA